ncbi:beta-alanine transporter-like [Dermacentor andersoni]|uniref:beta-alanine transporter-like n=1 Tax=Dermacentor andersoni TaxID=34620 RepID=UPI003B3A9F65
MSQQINKGKLDVHPNIIYRLGLTTAPARSPPAEYAFVPEDTWRNLSIPVERDGASTSRSQCHRYEPPFEHPAGNDDITPPENRSVVPCDAGWHYENGARSGKRLHSGAFGLERDNSIVVEWDLVCDRGWIVSALTAAYMAGGVVGAPVAGIAADRIGRRPVLCIWFLLLISSGTMLVFAHNLPVFAALRFLLSAGASGVLVASHVLLFEVTDTEHRVSYCAIAVAGATFAAAMYAELVYVYIRNWHAAQVT